MLKKLILAAQLILAAFLVKFLDADSDSGGSDSDSGGSDSGSGGSDSDSGSLEGSSETVGSSLESSDFSDGSENSDSNSSQKKPRSAVQPEDLLNKLSQEDLSQIPRRH
jgi:hypothetical protein